MNDPGLALFTFVVADIQIHGGSNLDEGLTIELK